jgi:hypothetical protein
LLGAMTLRQWCLLSGLGVFFCAQPISAQTMCAPGTVSDTGNSPCTECAKGKFQALGFKTLCDDCPSGHSSGFGATGCTVDCSATIYTADDTQVQATDGWNEWSASCIMSSQTVASGATVKIKKSASMSGELVIDRGATSGENRHFLVYGTLEMEDVTLTGGYAVSSFCSFCIVVKFHSLMVTNIYSATDKNSIYLFYLYYYFVFFVFCIEF